MKKVLSLILCFLFIVLILCSCSEDKLISERIAIDTRYTPAYDTIQTDTRYEYDWLSGEFVLFPDTHTVHHNEKYEVRYSITYSDGSTKSEWLEVGRDIYEYVNDELPP